MTPQQIAILALGRALRQDGYHFVVPTPLTCKRVLARPLDGTRPLVDAFGWNRAFAPRSMEDSYLRLLEQGGLAVPEPDGRWRSRLRFSSLGGMLFAHSGFPTDQPDSIFFGPDTYRFARAVRWVADSHPSFSPRSVIDIGAGSGAGGLFSSAVFGGLAQIVLSDINQKALEFSAVNAALNDVGIAETCHSDVLEGIDLKADLIIANPPYLVDPAQRVYRHGGGDWGTELARAIVEQSLAHLSSGGCLLLYTGTPIVGGTDKFLEAVQPVLERRTRRYRYEEIDPDVFGEELENAPYDQADRIATVMLFVTAGDITR